MKKPTAKEILIDRIEKLPDDVTISEAMSWLLSLRDVEISLHEEPEEKISHEELMKELKKDRKKQVH